MTTAYAYINTQGKQVTTRGAFGGWIRRGNVMFARFERGKTPLLVPESSLCYETLERLAQIKAPTLAPVSEPEQFNVYGIEADFGGGEDWFDVMLEYRAVVKPLSDEPFEPPTPAQIAIEERITANRQMEAMYADEMPAPEPRFNPAPEGFEPSVKDADVWAAAERASTRISAHGLPIKHGGLFFKRRADVWARREVWPLVIWRDEDMTLVIWRNGRIFLCAIEAAVEVDLPKSTLNKLYQIHFGGNDGR